MTNVEASLFWRPLARGCVHFTRSARYQCSCSFVNVWTAPSTSKIMNAFSWEGFLMRGVCMPAAWHDYTHFIMPAAWHDYNHFIMPAAWQDHTHFIMPAAWHDVTHFIMPAAWHDVTHFIAFDTLKAPTMWVAFLLMQLSLTCTSLLLQGRQQAYLKIVRQRG